MTEMPEVQTASHKDRSTGLVVFGILEILIGVLAALLAPMTLLGLIASARVEDAAGTASAARMMIPGIAFYILLAIFFIWVGIGSIKARRWARAVMLIVSWLWLLAGVLGMVMWIGMMPQFFQHLSQAGVPESPNILTVITLIVGVVMAVIYLILPGIFVLFYRMKSVKQTCEARDPVERWTDRCPLPVLALVIIMLYGGISMLMVVPFGAMPFFGTVLVGVPAIVLILVLAVVMLVAARLCYRMDPVGWWVSAAIAVVGMVSMAVTFTRMDIVEFYERMGITGQQLEAIKAYETFTGASMILWSVIPLAAYLVFLLYLRRYFKPAVSG